MPKHELTNVGRFKAALLATALAGGVAIAPAMPAFAEERSTDGTAAEEKVLGAIVVSATRREESSQDVPIAMSVVSEEQIESLRIERATDVADQSPNFLIEEQFGLSGPKITVRGIANADFNAVSNTPVTVYSDGVVLNSIQDQGFAVFDTGRVELLRGPQGTFFGRNSTSGAVQYVSAQPTEELSGRGSITLAEFGQRRVEAALAGPIGGDFLLGRIAVMKNDSDGYVTNTYNGKKTPVADDFSIRGILSIPEGGGWDANLKVQYSKSDGEAILFHNALPTNTITGEPGGPASDFREISLNLNDRTEYIESYLSALTLNFDLDGAVLTSVTGYSEHDFYDFDDDDAGTATNLHEYFSNSQNQFSQEFRIASDNQSALEWIAGAYYLSEDVDSQLNFDFTDLFLDPGTGYASSNRTTQELTSYAVFGEATYDVSERLALTGGIRWSKDEKDFSQTLIPCFYFDPNTSMFNDPDAGTILVEPSYGCPTNGTITGSKSWSDVSGKLALEYQYSEDMLLYASYARGFKGGGFNGGAATLDEFSIVEPESINAYEVGLKSQLFDRRATFNLSGFYYDYIDQQQFALSVSPDTNVLARQLINIPKSKSYGVEAELFTEPVDGLNFNLALGVLDTEFTDFVDADGYDYSGNEFPGAPKVNFSGLLSYEIPVGSNMVVRPQLDWSYVGENYVDLVNSTDFLAGDFWDLNARVTIANVSDTLKLSIFVENLTDEIQFTNHFDPTGSFGGTISTLRKPRQFGVTLSTTF